MFSVEQLSQLSNFLIKDFETVFATKEEMNQGFKELNEKFSQLQSTVDGFAKSYNDNDIETTALGHRVDTIETWVKKAAPKVGLDYKP
jgi:hypothetical protein